MYFQSPDEKYLCRITKYKGIAVGIVGVSLSFLPLQAAFAAPEGGVVSNGVANITNEGSRTQINQITDKTVIDWQNFDTTSSQSVDFNQPDGNSIALNRIRNGNATQFDGQLHANGQVWVVNPNGVTFGPHAQVDVNGLVATSSDISNSDFMAGLFRFLPGSPTAKVSNQGRITVGAGGHVALVAPHVENSGTISATLGKVHLASGDVFVADPFGDGLINLEASGSLQNQNVTNSGVIIAHGGEVSLQAAAPTNHVDAVISSSGTIEAAKVSLFAEGSNAITGNAEINKHTKTGQTTVWVDGKSLPPET